MNVSERNRPYWLAAVFALGACAALMVDVPMARYAGSHSLLGDLRKILDVSEVFAHGLGVLMVLLTAAVLDPLNRPRLPRVAACAYGAGLVVQVVKHLVPRIRPNTFDTSADVLHTFLPWSTLAFDEIDALGSSAIQSFPSGHTATAVGLAFGLAWVYPRGRWLFACFAALAALQRVQCAAHFVSDTLAAAAIGCLVAGLVLRENKVGRWFSRREASGWGLAASGLGRQAPGPET
jgi:membrane-associated phospholipid phosphatase